MHYVVMAAMFYVLSFLEIELDFPFREKMIFCFLTKEEG